MRDGEGGMDGAVVVVVVGWRSTSGLSWLGMAGYRMEQAGLGGESVFLKQRVC